MFQDAISPNPWYLILYITSHCNQRCNMCFNWKMLNTLKREEEWSLEEIEKLARQLPNLYQLTLTGGEPTLRKDLADVVQIFYKFSHVRRVTIATNAYYPDRIEQLINRVMSTCPDIHLSINMSLDGIGKKHDKIRGLEGSFDRLIETYKLVQNLKKKYSGLHSATASVLTVSNQDDILELLDFIDQHMDITTHGLMLARGDIPTEEGSGATDERFIKVLRRHREMARRKGGMLNNAIADTYTQARIDTLTTKRMKDPCLAGKKLIIIDERANVHPCEILQVLAEEGKTDAPELDNFSFGNLKEVDYDLKQLLSSPRGKAIQKFIKDERCWCTFECAQINNFVLNPEAYMRTIRTLVSAPQ